jgi:hypothetical protein
LDPDNDFEPLRFNPFDNPGKSFVKSIIMLTGEFDYTSTFEKKLSYPGTSHVIYLAFVVLITLILGNLLVALAVNELQKIQRQADIKRLVNMIELIAYVEYVIPYSKIVYSPTEHEPPFFRPNDRENRDKLFLSLRRGLLSAGFPMRKVFAHFSTSNPVAVSPSSSTSISTLFISHRETIKYLGLYRLEDSPFFIRPLILM